MGDILDAANRKMATIDDDGKVRNLQNVVIGRGAVNGDVYDALNKKIT